MADGSSPAKLPGISLDNTAYNTIYGNIVRDNYGSGIKAVRSAFSNTILCNQIIDNNRGASDTFHFFGIELSTDLNADEAVQGLDLPLPREHHCPQHLPAALRRVFDGRRCVHE